MLKVQLIVDHTLIYMEKQPCLKNTCISLRRPFPSLCHPLPSMFSSISSDDAFLFSDDTWTRLTIELTFFVLRDNKLHILLAVSKEPRERLSSRIFASAVVALIRATSSA